MENNVTEIKIYQKVYLNIITFAPLQKSHALKIRQLLYYYMSINQSLCAFFLLMISPKEVCYCLYKASTVLNACKDSNE